MTKGPLAHNEHCMTRTFVELPAFTRLVQEGRLADDELAELQLDIMKRRGRIDRVPGVPGLQKMRWRNPRRRRGARGGYRVFFVDFPEFETVILIYLMDKAEQDDLSPEQRRQFTEVIRQLPEELAR